jgi:hypothetical protein
MTEERALVWLDGMERGDHMMRNRALNFFCLSDLLGSCLTDMGFLQCDGGLILD